MELLEKDYLTDLKRIKETIKDNQDKAMVIVNSAMIMTYYEIGTIINQRKTWGSKYIQKLSEDLKEYGNGYSVQNLKFMSQFANEFCNNRIGLQVASQIPWFTLIRIITKSKSHEEMLWYINETYKNGWSRSTVLKQFEAKTYERGLIAPDTTTSISENDKIKELFKDTYVLSFLNKENTKKEIDLKNALLDNVIEFLHELGPGFTLVGDMLSPLVEVGASRSRILPNPVCELSPNVLRFYIVGLRFNSLNPSFIRLYVAFLSLLCLKPQYGHIQYLLLNVKSLL